jgi:hypothetical protein
VSSVDVGVLVSSFGSRRFCTEERKPIVAHTTAPIAIANASIVFSFSATPLATVAEVRL